MTNDAYEAWLDAMPIDDVRRRIERFERKLSDSLVLARLYAVRQPGEEAASGPASEEASSEPTGEQASAEPASAEDASEPAVGEASPESGSSA